MLRILLIGHLVLAVLQALTAIALLWWAVPLFVDPPLLGNGIARFASELKRLALQNPEQFRRIPGLDSYLTWVFRRYREGTEMAIVAAVALLGSSVTTIFLGIISNFYARKLRDMNT